MKPRSPERTKPTSELDALNARLDQVRTEARRLAEVRQATKRKLESIGKNLGRLRDQLDQSRPAKSRPKK